MYYVWENDGPINLALLRTEDVPVNSQIANEPYCVKPILLDGVVIESITQEELDLLNKEEVPQEISPMRLRTQLITSGITIKSIDDMINGLPDGLEKDLITIKWEYSLVFERQDKTLIQMAYMLGLTDEDLDNLFINGNK